MPNTPTHFAYTVRDTSKDGDEKRSGIWSKIGAAWAHKDGKGFDVVLDSLPVDGHMRPC